MLEILTCEFREILASLNPGSEVVYESFQKNVSSVDIILVQNTNNTEKYLTVGLVFRWITNMPVCLARKMISLPDNHRRHGDAAILNGYVQQI